MMKSVLDAEIENKIIFLRVDWNVPFESGKILNDSRIRATLPTINYLLSKNCRIVIGTHLGRPEGDVVPQLSTKILAMRFSELIKTKICATDYVIESAVKKQIDRLGPKEIIVIGNLRWHAEEETNNLAFAHILSSYAEAFVNDAFAVCHRAHASVEAITNFLPGYAGLLLEKEVNSLRILTQRPRHPFVLVLGGAKIKDKVGLIKKFAPMVDKILVGGAIANTLRYFQGHDIGNSYCETDLKNTALGIFAVAKNKIVLPNDEIRKDLSGGKFSIMDIGPQTIAKFKEYISPAKTIFWNGNMGYSEDNEYETGTLEIAKAIRDNSYTKIIAGGDTAGFIDSHNMVSGYSFVSTGGGAALEFLAGAELPALKALGYYNK